ncbi:MAG TPA: winged helix DNA-binding domain-containing protein [Solirubrobacteraceae bacterium]|nr:winged helix DNA-binding domain-containing protein [Solirubrobacteraceae bacterium]
MIAERLAAQLLAGPPARDPVEVTRRLLAVQGQDQRGVRLAIRARSRGLTVDDVDRALTIDRSLLITWLNRGTLHLVAREDYPWLHALTAPPQLMGNARRLSQEGVTPEAAERGVAAVEHALADEGPLGREQLRDRLGGAGVPTAGQALVHVLLLCSLRGLVVRGPMIDGRHAYALVRDWLGPPAPVDRERALAELARRYLAGHGPAEERDLARWAGLPLRDARAGLSAIASELREREDGLLDLARSRGSARLPAPRLLGAFDPLLLGWRSREALLGADEPVVTVNGLFRPFALVRGRAVATWGISKGAVTLKPFAPLATDEQDALAADATDVLRYLRAVS